MEIVSQDQEPVRQGPQYQVFKKAGGSLSEDDYKITVGMVKQMTRVPSTEDYWIRKAKKTVMGKFDDITTSPRQKAIYCFLRRRKEGDSPLVIRASGLTDQETMADIILMTGTVDEYSKYVKHYPAIAKRRFPEGVEN